MLAEHCGYLFLYCAFFYSFSLFFFFFFFCIFVFFFFFFQAEDGIRFLVRSRGLGDVYKRQPMNLSASPSPQPSPKGEGVAYHPRRHGRVSPRKPSLLVPANPGPDPSKPAAHLLPLPPAGCWAAFRTAAAPPPPPTAPPLFKTSTGCTSATARGAALTRRGRRHPCVPRARRRTSKSPRSPPTSRRPPRADRRDPRGFSPRGGSARRRRRPWPHPRRPGSASRPPSGPPASIPARCVTTPR